VEVCAKFCGDWYGSMYVKEGHRYIGLLYFYTSQPGPGSAREKFDELTLHKVFSPVTHLGFEVWVPPGSRGRVCGVMLVLRTFPELVGRSVQNIKVTVCTYVPMSLFHTQTARPISTKFCTDLHTNS